MASVDEPSSGTTHLSPVRERVPSVVTPYKARQSSFYKPSTDCALSHKPSVQPEYQVATAIGMLQDSTLESPVIPLNVPTASFVCATTLNNLCYFHHRLGDRARNCRQPCSWEPDKSRSTNADRSSRLPRAHNQVPAQMPLQRSTSENIPPSVSVRTISEPS